MNKEEILKEIQKTKEHLTNMEKMLEECKYERCAINFEEWNGEIIRYSDCSNYPNCYFKQLKCKEQECEKLKTQILSLQTMEIEELKNYKQALDEI